MRTVGEFWENKYKENFRLFWVNFENIRNFGKNVEKTSKKFLKNFRIWKNFNRLKKF